MNRWILNLIMGWYAFPFRTVERDHPEVTTTAAYRPKP